MKFNKTEKGRHVAKESSNRHEHPKDPHGAVKKSSEGNRATGMMEFTKL